MALRAGAARRASATPLSSARSGRAASQLACPGRLAQAARHVACAAWDGGGAEWGEVQPARPLSSSAPVSSAADSVARMLATIGAGQPDGLLDYVSDEIIDLLLAQARKSSSNGTTGEVHLADVLKANRGDLLGLDTFAVRNLVLNAPSEVQVLSAMHVGPERYLQRCAIVAPSGEECVLTFDVSLQECLECQYRGPPLMSRKWLLSRVAGECNSDELPAHPSPSFPPEAVVEAQLAALREGRVASVFAHASPENKAATGPLERFAALLAGSPAYAPLLRHGSAQTVQRLQPSDSSYMEVVAITPGPAAAAGAGAGSSSSGGGQAAAGAARGREAEAGGEQPLLFMWILSRQDASSTWGNCWMTDAVQQVHVLPAAPKT